MKFPGSLVLLRTGGVLAGAWVATGVLTAACGGDDAARPVDQGPPDAAAADADAGADRAADARPDAPVDANEAATAVVPVAISVGYFHSCALLSSGAVKCWGRSDALGLGDTNDRGDQPAEMGNALPAVDLGTGRTAKAIAVAYFHTCAILDDDRVRCWGRNTQGSLGLGDVAPRGNRPGEMGDALPVVDLGVGRTAKSVVAGADATCAVLDDATLKCWGYGAGGSLGLGDPSSRGDAPGEMGDALPKVSLGTGRTALAVTASIATCAILDDSSAKCWGNGESGMLGRGVRANRGAGAGEMGDQLAPLSLGAGRTALALSAGGFHMCAILDTKTAKCWGRNEFGQLGLGDVNDRGDQPGEMGSALPVVDLGPGRTVKKIASGYHHTCALLDDDTLKCWGGNGFGELGMGDTTTRGHQPGQMGNALLVVKL